MRLREDAGDDGNVGAPVTATDPDAGDELAYSITGGADMSAFAIDSTSGQIKVKKGSTLDFEGSQTSYEVEVAARDPFGLSDSTTVTINGHGRERSAGIDGAGRPMQTGCVHEGCDL